MNVILFEIDHLQTITFTNKSSEKKEIFILEENEVLLKKIIKVNFITIFSKFLKIKI